MEEIIPRDLLACIRYEFQLGHPFCEALENFCKVFGNDAITFGNFEFWWYRFKEGNFDLDYKGPPKPGLSNIPLDIVEEIVGKMEWKERCLFRKVSKKCRQVVDSVPYTFDEVDFDNGTKYVDFQIDNIDVAYHERRSRYYDSGFIIKTDNFLKRAFTDFMCILKNPKIQIKTLRICGTIRTTDKLKRLLHTLPHQIHVERLELNSADYYKTSSGNEELLSILPYLKPGILSEIDQYTRESLLRTDELAKLDQWKQAKSFETDAKIPKNFEHFEHFHVLGLRFDYISAEDFVQFTNIFSNSTNFQSASVWCNKPEENIMEKLKGFKFEDQNVSIKKAHLISAHIFYISKKNISC